MHFIHGKGTMHDSFITSSDKHMVVYEMAKAFSSTTKRPQYNYNIGTIRYITSVGNTAHNDSLIYSTNLKHEIMT